MTTTNELLEESADDLFENAPCGYLTTLLDGTIVKVNRTFEDWTGYSREELLALTRFQDLLSPGGRIYYETHYAPLLHIQGSVREIALEILRVDGSRLPALINSVCRRDDSGRPQLIRTTVFDATDRRRYEQELLLARRREQKIADQLQRSMLSGTLPTSSRVELAVAYRPAVSGLQIGGDWYDAFWLDEGETLGLVVGDVVGRGIDAAATMGQLRSAVRALASTSISPGPLIDALDQYARRHEIGQMTTLIYAQLSLSSGQLRYACAGHPPPVIATPDDQPEFAWEGRSRPLDTYVADHPRGEGHRRLAPGTMLLLYTDGLVERRSHPIDEDMDRLLAVVSAHGDQPARSLTRALVDAQRDPEHPDDVCVLAARIQGGAKPAI
jgi:phosphoserine phosphatase RsbU/P